MVKAVKLSTRCEYCNHPVEIIITKDKLGELVAAVKTQELLEDLAVSKHAYAKGVNIRKKLSV